MTSRVHLFVKGRVQGVFFRAWVKERAIGFNLVGFVRNLDDGRVEIVAEGEKGVLENVVKLAREGSKLASVEHLDVIWEKATGEFKSFEVRSSKDA